MWLCDRKRERERSQKGMWRGNFDDCHQIYVPFTLREFSPLFKNTHTQTHTHKLILSISFSHTSALLSTWTCFATLILFNHHQNHHHHRRRRRFTLLPWFTLLLPWVFLSFAREAQTKFQNHKCFVRWQHIHGVTICDLAPTKLILSLGFTLVKLSYNGLDYNEHSDIKNTRL